METPRPLLLIERLRIAYRGNASPPVIDGVWLSLERGEIGCVVGSSGCGKTTLLRAIAGFIPVEDGTIEIAGAVVSGPRFTAAAERRGIGLVFQDYSLFPHLKVEDNIAFGLRHLGPAERASRVQAMIELVGLGSKMGSYPHELSGGQQQRVALARALAPRPALLLMDEPFSSLDVDLRARLGAEVRQILKASDTTAMLVTHDQQEAFAMADRVGVMNSGRIEQWDRPYELYHRPATRYVADFIGEGVFLPAKVLTSMNVEIELGELQGKWPLSYIPAGGLLLNGDVANVDVDVLLRPDDVVHDDASELKAEVVRKVFRGGDFVYTLRLASGREVLALVPSHHDHAIGEKIGIRLDADHVITFPSSNARPGAA
ncbi:MAG: ABC transporter ATP-binding protein [Burkholderiaceae bacterium]|nr:ABC transporter ATP-binding protein [Burkholderiaceae bacterium]